MSSSTLAHTLMKYHLSQFGHWDPEKADTLQSRYKNCFSERWAFKTDYFAIYTSGDAGAVTISSFVSDFYNVINHRCFLQGQKLTASTRFASWICMESVAVPGERTWMNVCDCGFSELSLIWLLSGRDVTAGISDCPRTISRVCICSPTLVGDAVAAVVSIWGLMTAGTINSTVPYFISLSRK